MRNHFQPDFIDNLRQRRSDEHYNAVMRIGDAHKLYHECVRSECDQDGLPVSYRMLLFHLSVMEEGVTQLTLVKATHLKPPTVSVTLQKMEADGLVIRKSNERDLRETLVYLSDKGKAIHERIHRSHIENSANAMKGFTPEEQILFCSMLDRMIDNLIEAKQNKCKSLGEDFGDND